MGNVHVTNHTRRPWRFYVAQRKFVIKELVVDAKLDSAPLDGHRTEANTGVQATVDYNLNTEGYAWVAPGKSLEFVYHILRGDVYISALAGDGSSAPIVACHNYCPPPGREVIVVEDIVNETSLVSVTLVDKVEWVYNYGVILLTVGTLLLALFLFLAILHPLYVFVEDSVGSLTSGIIAPILGWFKQK